jgi:release factor glutamine methyltransferase
MTVGNILKSGKAFLKNANIESFSLDAEILLAYCLSVSRSELFLKSELECATDIRGLYNAALEKRVNGVCVAYITGHKEFRYLDLFVDENVLVPRPDTEILVEAAEKFIDAHIKNNRSNIDILSTLDILDICTGSGAVAIALKTERPFVSVSASDICGSALEVAKKNIARYKLENDLTLYKSDLFANIPETQKYDIITANPPYIESAYIPTLEREVQNEPHLALDGGVDGLDIIRRIITYARQFLKPDSVLLLEAQSSQMQDIERMMRENNYRDVTIYKDLSGEERVIVAPRQRGFYPFGLDEKRRA